MKIAIETAFAAWAVSQRSGNETLNKNRFFSVSRVSSVVQSLA
jgi:hypothetical protein